MPDSPERGTREAARRQAVDTLKVAAAVAAYAARGLSDGLSPGQSRLAVLEAAGDLERAASRLRELARPPEPAERRALARELAADGWSPQDIAGRLGVTGETARRYLRVR